MSQPEMVSLTIDDAEISVPKGTLVIRAAELMGIQIPRFCDHPLLAPALGLEPLLVEREVGVALGEVKDPALAAALGGADLDRAAAALGDTGGSQLAYANALAYWGEAGGYDVAVLFGVVGLKVATRYRETSGTGGGDGGIVERVATMAGGGACLFAVIPHPFFEVAVCDLKGRQAP